jgi:hypothetical protein
MRAGPEATPGHAGADASIHAAQHCDQQQQAIVLGKLANRPSRPDELSQGLLRHSVGRF